MKFVPKSITQLVGKQSLLMQKNSPTLLFGVGVVGVVATAVLASRATLKLDEILDETQADIAAAKQIASLGRADYDDETHKKDQAIIYAKATVNIIKLYGPAIVAGAVTVGCLAGSHRILSKRNAGLVAAYSALEKGFNEYRARVIDEYGSDKDRELRHGTRVIKEKVEKDGKTKEVERKVAADGHSIYARLWGQDTTSQWNPEDAYNICFLKAVQQTMNNNLHSRGHVFLNDVHDALGLERTKEGAVVGWVLGRGDDWIDFGIFDNEYSERVHDFFTGREQHILLDFNVAGVIWDQI